MSISGRIEATIESWRVKWGKALHDFLGDVLSWGTERLFDAFEPDLREEIRPQLEAVIATEGVPEATKDICRKALETTSFIQLAAIVPYLIMVMFMLGYGATMPIGTAIGYPTHRLVKDFRLDPRTITSIWLRDKAKYEKLWQDLKDQGWRDDQLDVAKELAKVIPPLSDMVRFADFSAFDPEVIEKWREFYDAPGWVREPFELIGIFGEWTNRYWFSHWTQPGRYELGEMHRRNLIDDETVKLAYRTMGYSSFWQETLLELVKAVPTRVDVRRWWDMRTIDETRLREIYHAQGYYGKDLDDYVLWTKVYVAFPDLMARFKKGWITEDDVRTELTALGMPPERVEEMIQTKIKKAEPERVEKERDLTKTDIYRGVKKGVISELEGIELLQDMGYSEDEARYIIEINVAAAEGSPETYSEYKQITQLYRKAMGLKAELLPQELIEASKALAEAKRALEQVRAKERKDITETEAMQALSAAEYRYKQLLAQWQAKKGKSP